MERSEVSFSSCEIASAGLQSAAGVNDAENPNINGTCNLVHAKQPQFCPCSGVGGLYCLSSLVSFPYLFSWPIGDGGVILGSGARVLFMANFEKLLRFSASVDLLH